MKFKIKIKIKSKSYLKVKSHPENNLFYYNPVKLAG